MRFILLDNLRFFAVTFTILRHLPVSHSELPIPLSGIVKLGHVLGGIGVDLFFVLSGFLVGGLLMKEFQLTGSINWWRFIVRRGFKIFPSFYLCLCTLLILNELAGIPRISGRMILSELFFLQSYLPNVLGFSWSLSVEEHFYLLLSLGFLFVLKPQRAHWIHRIPHFALFVFCYTVLARVITYHVANPHPEVLYFPTHLHLDGLMLGVGVAYLYHFRTNLFARISEFERVLAVILFGCFFVNGYFAYKSPYYYACFGMPFFAAGFTALLVYCLHKEPHLPKKLGVWRGLSVLGKSSYSIYLWHAAAPTYTLSVIKRLGVEVNPWMKLTIYLVVPFLAGHFFAKHFEFPVTKLRERFRFGLQTDFREQLSASKS